jgi:RNA polymerase sigma-70 factor, ECF subfamily
MNNSASPEVLEQLAPSSKETVVLRTDADLINEALSGKVESFSLLISRHETMVRRILLAKTRDPFRADDFFQAATLKCYTKLSQFRFLSSFGTWFTQIALNEARQHYRHERSLERHYLAYYRESPRHHDAGHITDGMAEQQQRAMLRETLQVLPEAYRDVMVLRYLEGLSVEQVGGRLGISTSAVKSRIYRGVRMTTKRVRATMAMAA